MRTARCCPPDEPSVARRRAGLSVYAASIAAGLRKAPAKATKWTKADAYMQKVNA